MSKQIRNSLLLGLAALIWGTAFVAQSKGGDAVGPYSFNCIRALIGAVVLLPVIAVLDRLGLSRRKPSTREEKRNLWRGGVICGTALFMASSAQQLGITYGHSVGKAGFLTAVYILFVPILGILWKKKCPVRIWIGVIIALAGFYLLCLKEGFTIEKPDLLLLASAVLYSIQILSVDKYSPLCDGVRLSCIEFLVCGILGILPAFCLETLQSVSQWTEALSTLDAWLPILYAGVMSNGIAYTLQIIGQNGINPTLATMIMSLESVFSALAGAVLLHEKMSNRELFGCVLIFAAIIIAQLPQKESRYADE